MKPEWCQGYCQSLGYRLSGVEYGQECHCDNEINPTAVNGSDQCSWNCGGTQASNTEVELCGGLGYINVYNLTDPIFNANGSMENTAGNAQPYTPAAGFGDNYLGCWQEPIGGRILASYNTQQQNMTLAICAAICGTGQGHQFYGLEYGYQWYDMMLARPRDKCRTNSLTRSFCGDYINPNGTLLSPTTTPSNSTCNNRCYGAGAEICGGPNALSLYNNTSYRPTIIAPKIGQYRTRQCVTDPSSQQRALAQAFTSNPNMTVDMYAPSKLALYTRSC